MGLEFITGTELTAEHQDREIHILGYFLDETNARLVREMERFQRGRQERIVTMVRQINSCGVPLKIEAVHRIARCKSPGRPHVARALVEEGFCGSYEEAFERFLKRHKPGWAPKCRVPAEDAIELIHDSGGVAVLAHPGITRFDEAIPALQAARLDGIECFHSRHSAPDSERYLELAEAHGLLVTGGSDCHGFNKKEPLIGTVKLPQKYLDSLKERAVENRGSNQQNAASLIADDRASRATEPGRDFNP